MSTNITTKGVFSDEATANIVAFQDTLQRVHNRLVTEGYKFVDGKIIPPEKKKVYNDKTKPNGHSRSI
mgnify:CR=1 FL=1